MQEHKKRNKYMSYIIITQTFIQKKTFNCYKQFLVFLLDEHSVES